MPPLCKALDINHLWPSRYAVPIWPPRFLMRKLRRGVHTTMQRGCWGSKPAHPDCRASSHPTIPPVSPQHSFGFGFYFQGEAQSMSLVPPAFTPNATLLKTPKGTNDSQGGLTQWSQTQVVPLYPRRTQATKLFLPQLPRRAPLLGRPFLPLARPQTCARGPH